MKRDFQLDDLKRVLESGYGVSVRTLSPLPGHAHSLNFKAETADGLVFAAKGFPAKANAMSARLLAHTASPQTPLAVTRLFDGKVLPFGDWNIMALRWIPGTMRYPDRLGENEMDAFLSAYAAFLDGLRDDGGILPLRDAAACKKRLLNRLRDGNADEIRRAVAGIPDEELSLPPSTVRIIHGDLHWENFRFLNGKVAGFLDLEELRFGTPAEDLVRYIICRAEHQRWYDFGGRRRLLGVLARFLEKTPFSREEWLFAIDGYLLRKLEKKIKSNRIAFYTRVNLLARLKFYRALRSLASIAPSRPQGQNGRRVK